MVQKMAQKRGMPTVQHSGSTKVHCSEWTTECLKVLQKGLHWGRHSASQRVRSTVNRSGQCWVRCWDSNLDCSMAPALDPRLVPESATVMALCLGMHWVHQKVKSTATAKEKSTAQLKDAHSGMPKELRWVRYSGQHSGCCWVPRSGWNLEMQTAWHLELHSVWNLDSLWVQWLGFQTATTKEH